MKMSQDEMMYEELKERCYNPHKKTKNQILASAFKEKLLKAIWPPFKQRLIDEKNEAELLNKMSEDEAKYETPSYEKPDAMSWEDYRFLPF